MKFFKKYIVLLLILQQISIQSAYMFKKSNNELREHHWFDHKDLKNLNYGTIPTKDLLFGFGPNNEYTKIAFLEEKANGKYQVHSFTLVNPDKSIEFTNKEEAQFFLWSFMLDPVKENIAKRPYFKPIPARGSGQSWRSTSSSKSARKK